MGVSWCTELAAVNQDTIDSADVCTPTGSHRAVAMTCASLGLPTLIDKPLAATLADADAIIAAFEAADTRLTPGHSTRFVPALHTLAGVAHSGRLGEVSLVSVSHAQGYAWPGGWRAWQLDPASSGGRIIHFGIHDVDLACWIAADRVAKVRATATPAASGPTSAWSSASIQLMFDGGCLGMITQAWDVRPPSLWRKSCLVVGTLGEATHDSLLDDVLRSDQPCEPFDYQRSLRDQLEHWLDVIESRSQPIVTPSQARHSLAVVQAAHWSATTDGRVVDLSEFEFDA